MAELTIHPLSADFDTVKQAADAAGDSYRTDNLVRLRVENGSGGVLTVTVAEQQPCDHAHHGLIDKEHSVAVGETLFLGPEDVRWAADADRMVHVSYSTVTSVNVAAYEGY
jgi:hypothetical protein